ncbi:DNA-directed RNA polymerase specialized sigma24 family protein [Sporosarcina luteola]|nr:DNA-directed RNA polymerase specialized sigma24 family protein [Sporosarcina luteola]
MEDLGEMYKSYAKQVKTFLILLTSNVDLAEELTQETFYQAVKSIHRYNGDVSCLFGYAGLQNIHTTTI